MAKLHSSFPITGKLENLTAYRLRGVDGIVVRRIGSVPADVRASSKFDTVRRNTTEFGGRAHASGWILGAMRPVTALGDRILGGALNALLKPVQELDHTSKFGERHVMLTRQPALLRGFSLNNHYPFNYVVRNPPECVLSRSELAATIRIPALIPKVNFFPSPLAPYYSIISVLGTVPDVFYSAAGYGPSHQSYLAAGSSFASSTWLSTSIESGPIELSLSLPAAPPDEHFTLILSVGIRYGYPSTGGNIMQKPKCGCGMVVEVG